MMAMTMTKRATVCTPRSFTGNIPKRATRTRRKISRTWMASKRKASWTISKTDPQTHTYHLTYQLYPWETYGSTFPPRKSGCDRKWRWRKWRAIKWRLPFWRAEVEKASSSLNWKRELRVAYVQYGPFGVTQWPNELTDIIHTFTTIFILRLQAHTHFDGLWTQLMLRLEYTQMWIKRTITWTGLY